MKQLKLSIIAVCLFFFQGLQAQQPQNRTVSTVVADALTQLPAKTPSQYAQTMKDLVSTGEAGLMTLIKMLDVSGSKSNELAEFAISGWTNFVAKDPSTRLIAANTYEKALGQSLDKEQKAFLIRQLEMIGNDDNIDVLSGFLSDNGLSRPSSQALVALRSEKGNQALLSALTGKTSEDIKINLVNALGQANEAKAEPELLGLLKSNPSEKFKGVLLVALGKIGTEASLEPLRMAAEAEDYSYQKDYATSAYLNLLRKMVVMDPQYVQQPASDLLLRAMKLGRFTLQVPVTEILMMCPQTNKTELLETAFKSGDIVYITNTLNAYPFQDDQKGMKLILKKLGTQSPEVRTAILYWLGNQKMDRAIPQISKYLRSTDATVQTAAIRSLSKIGGEKVQESLVNLLKGNNSTTISQAKEALLSYHGDLSQTLAAVYDGCGTEGKIAALQLMAARQMKSQYPLVLSQMSVGNDPVKAEAVRTLKCVVTEKNIPELFDLLEQSDASQLASIQEALNAALSYLIPDQQMQLVSEKMNQSTKSQLYYNALANIGTKAAMDAITKAYDSNTGERKMAAFDALIKWKSFDVIYPLLEIVRKAETPEIITQSTDAIISLIAGSDQTGEVKRLFLQEVMNFAQTEKQKNEILSLLGNTNSYQALLFVEPFLDQPAMCQSAAQAAMKIALNNVSYAGSKTASILEKVSNVLNNADASYQREAIRKFLSENSGEGGYESIFNGQNIDGWKGLVGDPVTRAKMSAKELSAAQAKADDEASKSWIVEKGELLFTGNGNNLCTQKKYRDFEMLVDWKLYPGKEPDAGIYLRGTPQVQIWDTARVNVGAQVGSGGLYNNKTNQSTPLKVADLKVGEWNTFHIKMTGDRVTVYLNGELVVNNVIMENFWDRNQPVFPMEQIELQAHGSKVAYRNIYVKEIPSPEPFKLSKEEEKEGFDVLFNGTNMYQWTGNTTDYTTENGNIVIYPSKSFGGNLYTKKEYGDFVYRFEFQLTPGANNGLGIRTPMEGDAAYVGMELQILDNEDPIYKDLHEYQYHGSVYGVIPSKRGYLKPVGEWNYEEVIAKGDQIKVILNGTVILDGNIREASKNGTMDKKNHPGLLNKKGHIGFLGHGTVVRFRNIRVKEL